MAVSAAGFTQASHVLCYSRIKTKETHMFLLRDYHPLRYIFPDISHTHVFCNSSRKTTSSSYNPQIKMACSILLSNKPSCSRFGLLPFRSPLLGRYCPCGLCFLFLQVLRCFTSLGSHIESQVLYHAGLPHEVSPFGHLRIKGYKAPPRSLSQPYHVLHRFLKPRHPPYALGSYQEPYTPHCIEHLFASIDMHCSTRTGLVRDFCFSFLLSSYFIAEGLPGIFYSKFFTYIPCEKRPGRLIVFDVLICGKSHENTCIALCSY